MQNKLPSNLSRFRNIATIKFKITNKKLTPWLRQARNRSEHARVAPGARHHFATRSRVGPGTRSGISNQPITPFF